MTYPKLRPLEAFPVEAQGQRLIGLRDPQGITENVAFIPQQWGILLTLLNGQNSVRDIQTILLRHSGQLVMSDQIQQIVDQLDEALLLDSPRFHAHRESVLRQFRQTPTRPAAHAGQSYPAEAEELRRYLDAFFQPPLGPGLPNFAGTTPVVALMVPHIDIRRGGYVYAHGYKEFLENCDADLFVIFGIAHGGTENVYTLTTKDFETPLGTVRTDAEFAQALARRCARNLFADEFVHKGEHSVEFQVIFLQHLLGDKRNFQIVPLLCGGLHEHVFNGTAPIENPQVAEFVDALKRTVVESGRRVAFIVSVDLSHVGPRFGDPTFSGAFLRRAEHADQAFLEHVTRLDPQGLFQQVRADKDAFRIDAFPAIYTLLHVIAAKAGRLVKYDQMIDSHIGSAVGFASVVFYE
ncbi:MAG: AmmeMemoRadiSam system protein B [Abditibacteriales bacterium]|nr:AmmeMemoRadiSam system protein B [Abditibacteriales bacterium]MDW8365051.1 AmmeMemoRadiSam system protein B [Abditibacteriales bacterium]